MSHGNESCDTYEGEHVMSHMTHSHVWHDVCVISLILMCHIFYVSYHSFWCVTWCMCDMTHCDVSHNLWVIWLILVCDLIYVFWCVTCFMCHITHSHAWHNLCVLMRDIIYESYDSFPCVTQSMCSDVLHDLWVISLILMRDMMYCSCIQQHPLAHVRYAGLQQHHKNVYIYMENSQRATSTLYC